MRTKIVLAVLILLIGGVVGVGVAVQQQKYQQQKAQTVQQEKERQAELDIKNKVEINGLTARNIFLKEECEKGIAAYGLLTPQNKSKTAQPVCDQGIGQ